MRPQPTLRALCRTLFILTACACSAAAQAQERPNIVFIFSDDHAIEAVGAYGGRLASLNPTPNIDRLADEGMLFRNAFVTNSICAPSRAVILSGLHSHLNGVRTNRTGDSLAASVRTFPQILQEARYQTAMIGKWHLKSEPTGFDFWEVLPGQGHYYNPDFRTPDGVKRYEGYVSEIVTDRAINWLETERDNSEPFLLMYQHKAPHRNWQPGPDHLTTYDEVEIPAPKSLFYDYSGLSTAAVMQEMEISTDLQWGWDLKLPFNPEHPEDSSQGYVSFDRRFSPEQRSAWEAAYGPKNEQFYRLYGQGALQGRDLTRWKYQRYMKDYLRSIRSMDDGIGRVLDYLDEKGLDENTIVVYSSDQGFFLGENGWFDKRWMYEESLKMPLIVRWPGVTAPGSESEQLVQNLDFAQTMLDAAGVAAPATMQGRSLVPILRGDDPSDWREAVYYHYYEFPRPHHVHAHEGVRTDRYKLVHYYTLDQWELFDLQADDDELESLYGLDEYADITEQLRRTMEQLKQQYDVPARANVLSEEERTRGWRLLFDGTHLTSWRGFRQGGVPDSWEVLDGAIHLTGGDGADLITREQFKDFELSIEWKIPAEANSGIFYHVSEDYENAPASGPEYQIIDDDGYPDALDETQKTGANYALHARTGGAVNNVGEWNESRILVHGSHVEHWLNGEKVLEFEQGSEDWKRRVASSKFSSWPGYADHEQGHIALQNHGTEAWFRNVKIRTLGDE